MVRLATTLTLAYFSLRGSSNVNAVEDDQYYDMEYYDDHYDDQYGETYYYYDDHYEYDTMETGDFTGFTEQEVGSDTGNSDDSTNDADDAQNNDESDDGEDYDRDAESTLYQAPHFPDFLDDEDDFVEEDDWDYADDESADDNEDVGQVGISGYDDDERGMKEDEDEWPEDWDDGEDDFKAGGAEFDLDEFVDNPEEGQHFEIPDDLAHSNRPVDANYVPEDFVPAEAIAGAMNAEFDSTEAESGAFPVPRKAAILLGEYTHGFIDNVNRHNTSQVLEQNPNADETELEIEFFKRARRTKKRKQSGVSSFKGGWKSACGPKQKNCRNWQKIMNCDRGWNRDNQQCAHGCRFEFISKGGSSVYKYKLYKSVRYIRCEMCLVLSGLNNRWSFIHKSLGQLKWGTPTFCDIEADPEGCDEKDMKYAACSGVAVCQEACWSPDGSLGKCKSCRLKWCKRNKLWQKHFSICGSLYDKCMKEYHPDSYADSTDQRRVEGHLNCWGTQPQNPDRITYLDKAEAYPLEEQCARAMTPEKFPYIEYRRYFDFCRARVCNLLDEEDGDARVCDEIWCKNACFRSNGASKKCTDCSICRHCPIKNMAVLGNYDRKLNDGNPNLIIEELNIKELLSDLVRPELEEMTPLAWSLLPKNSCVSCNLQYERVTCRDFCAKFEKLVIANTPNDDPMYRWSQSICRSNRCVKHLKSKCKSCIFLCEKNGKRTWDTQLGKSEYNNNFKGYGCQLDCKAMQMAEMMEYSGVDINTIYSPDLLTANNIIAEMQEAEFDTEQIKALHDWANGEYDWHATQVENNGMFYNEDEQM